MARSTFPTQNAQTHHSQTTFGSSDVEKSARCCGANISKSKVSKTDGFGTRLGVLMSKRCTPLWREVARSTIPSQNVQNTARSAHFWKLRCCKSGRRCGAKHAFNAKCAKHHMYGPLLTVQVWLTLRKVSKTRGEREGFVANFQLQPPINSTALHYTTIHYTTYSTPLHHTTPHYTTPHHTPHYTSPHQRPHYTTLHYIALPCATLRYTTLHSTTPHSTPLPLHSTPLHYTTLHSITPHYATPHYTTLHHITLHYATLH